MRKVLVVDDEPHVSRVLRISLERAGYSVEVAANGELGLRRYQEWGPDVMVTDIRMPKMSGRELVEAIRNECSDNKLLIIVMTSSIELEYRDWTEGATNLRFVEKPVSPRKIIEIVNSVRDECLKESGLC